jgi:glycosyltransferase involved in cell wall biosynthesis
MRSGKLARNPPEEHGIDPPHPKHPVIWYIFPPIGGPGLGRYWRGYHLARAWQKAGARPILIGPGFHHYFLKAEALAGTHQISNVTYHFVPTKPYGIRAVERIRAIGTFGIGLLTDRKLAQLGALDPPDIVVYSSPYPFGYLAAHRIARRHGAGLVFEVRDIWPLSLIEILGTPRWHPFVLAASACERFAYATADRVVSLLPDAAAHMTRRGLDVGKFAYIPNGADVEETSAEEDETPLLARARTLAAEGRFVLAHSGNLSITANLFPLLKAAKLLREQGRTDISVLLVGRGEMEEALRSQVREDHLANVEFFPQVDKSEVVSLLRVCHAGFAALLPRSIYRFGYSLNKLFDYMLAELPVVFAAEIPGIVEKAGAGLRVPADDPAALAAAVAHLADLPLSERASMGERGRAFVDSEHNYRTLGQRYLNLFAEVRPNAFAKTTVAEIDGCCSSKIIRAPRPDSVL